MRFAASPAADIRETKPGKNHAYIATIVDELKLAKPVHHRSGPPGQSERHRPAFKEGWGAVIAKTVSLDSSKVVM